MTRRRTPILTTLTAGAMAILGVISGCSSSTSGETESGANVVKEGRLTVCTSLPFEPFEFRDGKKIVGFDIDLMDLVAKRLGAKLDVVNTPFEGIQSGQALNTGKCDVAATAFTITAPREEAMDFSAPYFDATQVLLTKSDARYASLEDLAGKSVGVMQGTTGQEYTEKAAPDSVDIKVFEDFGLLTTAVKTGSVAAGVQESGAVYPFVKENPDTKVAVEFDTGEQYGFAVKTGNKAVLDEVNGVIESTKADGTYDALFTKWFGADVKTG